MKAEGDATERELRVSDKITRMDNVAPYILYFITTVNYAKIIVDYNPAGFLSLSFFSNNCCRRYLLLINSYALPFVTTNSSHFRNLVRAF